MYRMTIPQIEDRIEAGLQIPGMVDRSRIVSLSAPIFPLTSPCTSCAAYSQSAVAWAASVGSIPRPKAETATLFGHADTQEMR